MPRTQISVQGSIFSPTFLTYISCQNDVYCQSLKAVCDTLGYKIKLASEWRDAIP